MPFPTSIAGTVTIPKNECGPKDVEQIGIRIANMLDTAVATNVVRQGASIRFDTGFFRGVGNSNILVALDSGTINIKDAGSEIKIEYQASTVFVFVSTTFLTGIMGVAVLNLPAKAGKSPDASFLVLLGFGWLRFVANCILAAFRAG